MFDRTLLSALTLHKSYDEFEIGLQTANSFMLECVKNGRLAVVLMF